MVGIDILASEIGKMVIDILGDPVLAGGLVIGMFIFAIVLAKISFDGAILLLTPLLLVLSAMGLIPSWLQYTVYIFVGVLVAVALIRLYQHR